MQCRNRDRSQGERPGAWLGQWGWGKPVLKIGEGMHIKQAPTFKILVYAFHSLVFVWIF